MDAIEFSNISKQYRLGQIGTGTISHDLNRWWASVRGKEDPFLKIGQVNDRSQKGGENGYVWALKDITFNVKQGDVVGIIGKNGAGKSTLLKILSRVTTPSTGVIRSRGRIASLLEVGTGFHPEMSGRENIYMNGAIMGMTKSEITRKLDEIVDFAGVAKYIDTPTKRYSSGMTVRLGFAIAAFLEPEILVVDEVLAVGDAEFQKKAIGKMQDVSQGEGRTVLFVSHNMGAIESLCKSIVVLEKGGVAFIGGVQDGINKYLEVEDVLSQPIKNGIQKLHYDFKIDSITINNSENNVVFVDENNHTLNIKIEGTLNDVKNIALEAMFYDYRGLLQGVFSPTHKHGILKQYGSGKFSIEETLTLPHNLTVGDFLLSIGLTDMRHEWYFSIPQFVRIISKGPINATGTDYSYSRVGLLILD